jgi:hypothetical protein
MMDPELSNRGNLRQWLNAQKPFSMEKKYPDFFVVLESPSVYPAFLTERTKVSIARRQEAKMDHPINAPEISRKGIQ